MPEPVNLRNAEIRSAATKRPIQLAHLRKRRGLTQTELAAHLNIGQPRIADMEAATTDLRLSTLTRYLAATGAELIVLARWPDGDHVEIDITQRTQR
jgi:transcriptional regulator with XRE-family HTH domain